MDKLLGLCGLSSSVVSGVGRALAKGRSLACPLIPLVSTAGSSCRRYGEFRKEASNDLSTRVCVLWWAWIIQLFAEELTNDIPFVDIHGERTFQTCNVDNEANARAVRWTVAQYMGS